MPHAGLDKVLRLRARVLVTYAQLRNTLWVDNEGHNSPSWGRVKQKENRRQQVHAQPVDGLVQNHYAMNHSGGTTGRSIRSHRGYSADENHVAGMISTCLPVISSEKVSKL